MKSGERITQPRDRWKWLLAAFILSGCGAAREPVTEPTTKGPAQDAVRPTDSPARIVPVPPIPVALRGCWRLDDPEIRDRQARLNIDATRIVETADWRRETVIATADFVEMVSNSRIEGRFRAPEGEHRMTLATMLSLGPDDLGTPAGKLRLSEGDAGSRWYSRCKTDMQDAK
ncbi:hypothetical protein OK349_18285 [Sphingomonas sp. BT-65]|uniref:hypothetical protein n=1 Tax=Sphingomonas sp. BT-65 TaxID=2989821 RepID=UPI002235A6E5|nr:hypothetical protein [Sphingomonas sp. BT-65]MCW4463658.1 hypothetical protein [Sphingomonas sp. BT-65]